MTASPKACPLPELLPCPFCGGEAIHGANDDGRRHVRCKQCWCTRDVDSWDKNDAAAKWNTRVTRPALSEAEAVLQEIERITWREHDGDELKCCKRALTDIRRIATVSRKEGV